MPLTLALVLLADRSLAGAEQSPDPALIANVKAWRDRRSAGHADDLLIVGKGFRDEAELAMSLAPYALENAALALTSEPDDFLSENPDEFDDAMNREVSRWVRSKHSSAVPVLDWTSLVPDAAYSADGLWWAGIEARDCNDGGKASALRSLLPISFGNQAATWAEVLVSLRGAPSDDDAQNAYVDALMAVTLARWLCGFDAAAENSFYNFSATEAAEVSGIDRLRLGSEAGRLSESELEATFDYALEANENHAGTALLACVKARTQELRHLLSTNFGGDSALLWSLDSSIWPKFNLPAWQVCNDLVSLHYVDPGELEITWTFVSVGWAQGIDG